MKETLERLKGISEAHSVKRHLGVFLFCLLVAFVLRFQGNIFSTQSYQVGDIATEDIYSPRDLTIVDDEATQTRRKESSENVKSVYDYNDVENDRILQRLREALTLARSRKSAPEE